MAVIMNDIVSYKRLVAAGNSDIYYEDIDVAAGTMVELDTSSGAIDTSDQLVMFEAYQKVVVVNGANIKIADFRNTKIIDANGFTNTPVHGTTLYQNGVDPAQIVVDYVDSANNVMYGYVKSGTLVTATAIRTAALGAGDVVLPSPDSVTAKPHWYDYTSYDNDATTYSSLPDKAYLGCLYRGRVVLSGDPAHPHQWYMSRQANPWDWTYIANDAQSPVQGGSSDAGELGDIVRALIPYKDDYLVFGCATSMWFLTGDPAEGGSINELDLTVGIFGANSYCFDGEGNMYFWGTNGIYQTAIPGSPTCISEVRLPDLVGDEAADPTTHRITMQYDRKRAGILTCVTKLSDGTNSNYWLDLRAKGFYPESYPEECGAYSLYYYDANATSYRDLLVGCKDGYIRKFDPSAKDDDIGASDEAISSYVTFGPFLLSNDAANEGKISGLDLILAGGAASGSQSDSDGASYEIYTARSAEEVVEKMYAGTDISASGTESLPGRGRGGFKRKVRGVYCGIKVKNVTAAQTWAIEQILVNVSKAGKLR